MNRYKEYKDSGVEWIGEVPSMWNVTKLKFIGEITLGKMLTSTPRDGYVLKPYLRSANIQDERIDVGNVKEMWFSKNELKRLLLVPGDLLLNEGGEVGRTAIYNNEINECYFQNSINRIRINGGNQRYFLYLSSLYFSIGFYEYFVNRVSIAHLTKEKLESVPFISPTLPEQTQIANYLDYQTQIIDQAIAQKELLIAKLKEQRQAIINEAVTKGLNPSAEMKNSGIEWLGEIPVHWTFQKTKRNTYMKGRIGWQGLKQDEFIDEGPYLITGMNFKDGVIRWNEVYHISQERYDQAPEIQLKDKDVLMTKDGTIGKLLYIDSLPGPTSLNSHLLVLRCTDGSYIPKFLYYQLMTNLFFEHIELNKTGTTFFGITQEAVGKYQMLLPPINEQSEIVEYIEIELGKVEGSMNKLKASIQKLKEYRQSIISEAVTGKVDLRDWKKP